MSLQDVLAGGFRCSLVLAEQRCLDGAKMMAVLAMVRMNVLRWPNEHDEDVGVDSDHVGRNYLSWYC